MIDIPPDVFLRTTLLKGTVYYYFHDDLRETQDAHYFVVLEKRETLIVLVCATTQLEKRKRFAALRGLPASTLVEIDPSAQNGLKRHSLFDCNHPFLETVHSLGSKHQTTPIRVKGIMEVKIVDCLVAGVLQSPLVSEEVKRLLR